MKLQFKTVSILPALLIGAWLMTSCDNGGGGGGNNNNGGGGDGNSSGSTGTLPAGTKSEPAPSGYCVSDLAGIKVCMPFSNSCAMEEACKSANGTIQKEKPSDCNDEFMSMSEIKGHDDMCYYKEEAPKSGYVVRNVGMMVDGNPMPLCYKVTNYCENIGNIDGTFQKDKPTNCYNIDEYEGTSDICKSYDDDYYKTGYCITVEDGAKLCDEYEYMGVGTVAKKECQDEKGTWSATKPSDCTDNKGYCIIGEGDYTACVEYKGNIVKDAKKACQAAEATWTTKKPSGVECSTESSYGKNPNALKNLKTIMGVKNEKGNR